MRKGTGKFFAAGKGYGSITDDAGGKDAQIHVSAVQAAGMPTLDEDQRFSSERASDGRGTSGAVNLQAARPADREALGGTGATLHPPRRRAATSLETSRARTRDTADKPDPASANQPLDNWENEGGSFTPSAAREIRRILEAAQMPTQQSTRSRARTCFTP
jgi:cold shock protein